MAWFSIINQLHTRKLLVLLVSSGHHAYLKFLVVLELLNNPVMHVFVALLKEVQGMRRYNGKLQFQDEKGHMHVLFSLFLLSIVLIIQLLRFPPFLTLFTVFFPGYPSCFLLSSNCLPLLLQESVQPLDGGLHIIKEPLSTTANSQQAERISIR